MRIEERLFHFQLLFNIRKATRDDKFAIDTEKWIVQNKNLIADSKLIIIYNDLSQYWFGQREYNKRLAFNNIILNNHKDIIYDDFITESRILHLLIHFELGNYDYLNYAFQSFHRTLLYNKNLYKSERIILKYLKKLVNTNENQSKLFNILEQELLKLKNDKFESFLIKETGIFRWLNEKKRSCIGY